MKGNHLKAFLCLVVVIVMVLGLVACGGNGAVSDNNTSSTIADTAKQDSTTQKATEPITIRVFTNIPDRTQGYGKLEQSLFDGYTKANPNVKLETEFLQDEPYKQKLQAYMASDDLPDFIHIWAIPSILNPIVDGGYVMELNPKDYDSYNFISGALDSCSVGGKLYGLPTTVDFWALYYNKDIFEKSGVKVPENFNDLIAAANAFRAKGITPCAADGKDSWPLSLTIQSFFEMVTGDPSVTHDAAAQKISFAKNADLVKAAKYYKQLMDAKLFQDGFTSADYGAARNLFVQGKAAMFAMGEWEVGMATDASIPEDIRNNIRLIKFPGIDGEKGSANSLVSWFGGGYAVSAKSKAKDEALKLLNYVMLPDNYAKMGWQTGAVNPTEKYDMYLTGQENELQKSMTNILSEAKSSSGPGFNDQLTPSFKTDSENLSQQFSAGMIAPEQFLEELDKAAAKANASK